MSRLLDREKFAKVQQFAPTFFLYLNDIQLANHTYREGDKGSDRERESGYNDTDHIHVKRLSLQTTESFKIV